MHIDQLKEQERLRLNREYFEDGCLCINTAKILPDQHARR
jgi:hypothetical protein